MTFTDSAKHVYALRTERWRNSERVGRVETVEVGLITDVQQAFHLFLGHVLRTHSRSVVTFSPGEWRVIVEYSNNDGLRKVYVEEQ